MSMFRVLRELTNISPVKAGGTTTVTLDPGPKYHGALLNLTDVALANLVEIRVKANSEVIHRYSATELDIMNRVSGLNAYNGGAGTSGTLYVGFDRPKLRQRVLEEDGAINTGQPDPETGDMITVLKIELQFAAGAYSPELTARAIQSKGTREGPGTIRRILSTSRSSQGAGRVTWSDFEVPSSKFMALSRVFIIPDANNILETEVFRKQDSVFLADSATNDFMLNQGFEGRKAVAGVFPVLFDLEGYGGNTLSLQGVSQGDYRVKVETDGAMQATMLLEYLGRLK